MARVSVNRPRIDRRLPVCPVFVLLGCLVAAAGATRVRGDDRVAVRAQTDPRYAASKFGGPSIRDESYLFAQGQFFPGRTRDRVLERMKFRDIVTNLADGLARRHYFPTQNLRTADLLIVVHWGVTIVADNTAKLMARNTLITPDGDAMTRQIIQADAQAERDAQETTPTMQTLDANITDMGLNALAMQEDIVLDQMDQITRRTALRSNAQLLGFADDLVEDDQHAFGTEQGRTLRSMLSDERYFVILLAYDYQALLKERKTRLLWTTRLSMQSPGMNFHEGVAHMTTMGSHIFGGQSKGVQVELPVPREGKVTIGEPRVLGLAEPER
jgi:hypothetical protein